MVSSKRICCRVLSCQRTKFDNSSTIAFLEWMVFKAKNAEMFILRIYQISKKVNLKSKIMLSTVRLCLHKDHEIACPRIDQTIQFHWSALLNCSEFIREIFAFDCVLKYFSCCINSILISFISISTYLHRSIIFLILLHYDRLEYVLNWILILNTLIYFVFIGSDSLSCNLSLIFYHYTTHVTYNGK